MRFDSRAAIGESLLVAALYESRNHGGRGPPLPHCFVDRQWQADLFYGCPQILTPRADP